MRATVSIAVVSFILAMAAARSAADTLPVESDTPRGFTIAGTIRLRSRGTLYLLLTNKELFKEFYQGLRHRVIDPDSTARRKGRVPFRFQDIPPGTYALRCYQDENGNEKLDMGLLGPSEPWDMSWNDNRPLGIPRFHHCAFDLTGDTANIVLELE